MNRTFVIGVLLLTLTACRRQAPSADESSSLSLTNRQVFAVRGIVRELDPPAGRVSIEHEAIPGYMMQMTMPFEVRDTNELAGLLVGDAVSFRMLVTDSEGWIDQVRRIALTNVVLKPRPRPPTRQVRMVEPLKVGDLLPDQPFTNQLGQPIRLGDFRGRTLGLTFIFTRCPYPNFCPRISAQFSEAARQLAAQSAGRTNWHLLSVSFDPDYDTPAVLKAYAERHNYDPARWSFATGAMIEVDAITEQFRMIFAPDGQYFSHNVRTVVVDSEGRVRHIFTGNEWKVDDFVAAMLKAAGPP